MPKIIFSRKGFDSSFGGVASPIFDDGSMYSLPIPSSDRLKFQDIAYTYKGDSLGEIVGACSDCCFVDAVDADVAAAFAIDSVSQYKIPWTFASGLNWAAL